MIVTVHTAKTQLSKLIEAAQAGEEVIISRGDKPVAKLVPIKPQRYRLGGMDEQISLPPNSFFDPMSAEELADWE